MVPVAYDMSQGKEPSYSVRQVTCNFKGKLALATSYYNISHCRQIICHFGSKCSIAQNCCIMLHATIYYKGIVLEKVDTLTLSFGIVYSYTKAM